MNTIEQAYINGFIKAAAPIKSFEELAELLSKAKAPAEEIPSALSQGLPPGAAPMPSSAFGPPGAMPGVPSAPSVPPSVPPAFMPRIPAKGDLTSMMQALKSKMPTVAKHPYIAGSIGAGAAGTAIGAGPLARYLGEHSVSPGGVQAKPPGAPGMGAELMKALANHKYLAMGGAGLAAGGGLAALLANHHKKEEQQPTEAPLANEPQPL